MANKRKRNSEDRPQITIEKLGSGLFKIGEEEYQIAKIDHVPATYYVRKLNDKAEPFNYVIDTRMAAIIKCTCPDAYYRNRKTCKHWHAVRQAILEGVL